MRLAASGATKIGIGKPPKGYLIRCSGEKPGDRWLYRTMFDEVPLPLDWPVYVSHAEASAYVRWAGKSLPTEAEWHQAAYGTAGEGERIFSWGSEAPNVRSRIRRFGNFDFHRWNPHSGERISRGPERLRR